MTLIDPKGTKRKSQFRELCLKIKQLHDAGKTNAEIENLIRVMELPLDMHMACLGRFTEICKYGRILSKTERKIYS